MKRKIYKLLQYFKVLLKGILLSREELELLTSFNWYHNFSYFGVKTIERNEVHVLNQQSKEQPMFSMIRKAISLLKDRDELVCWDLFCADGYFGQFAIEEGVNKVIGYDLEDEKSQGGDAIRMGKLISKILKREEKYDFRKKSVFELTGTTDICINSGGLYHIENPKELLQKLNTNVTGYMIVQTVYSLENSDVSYFVSPCPKWTWGCRFSLNWLIKTVEECNWEIVEMKTNELQGNKDLIDRGSVYLLLKSIS
jgi:hypothetical protein